MKDTPGAYDAIVDVPGDGQQQEGAHPNLTEPKIAAIFSGTGGAVHVIQSDGTIAEPMKEKEQVSDSFLIISEDAESVGWLVDSGFCCTSYPIQLMLVVYRPGEPLHRFSGNGRAISTGDL